MQFRVTGCGCGGLTFEGPVQRVAAFGTLVDEETIVFICFLLERVGGGQGADGEHHQSDDTRTPDHFPHVVSEFDFGEPDQQQERGDQRTGLMQGLSMIAARAISSALTLQ